MKIHEMILPSGLTVMVVPMTGAKTVTGVFAVRAGWKYETKETGGLAHFLEHMAFKGTLKRPTTLDISKEIEGRGGVMNASTSEEVTDYWIKMPSQFTDVLCEIIADITLNSKLDQEEINRERGTIIQELNMYRDNPQYYGGMICWPELLYGDQPAGRCCVGVEQTLKGLKREHFLDFLEKLYVSENAIFCLVGGIKEPAQKIESISRFFKDLRRNRPLIVKPSVLENQEKPALFIAGKDIKQSHIILGVRAFNLFHPKYYALVVLETILGGNMSSRMFIEVRERRGLAYYVGCFADIQTDVGTFGTSAGLDTEKVFLGIQTIMDEYRKIREEKVSDDELKRAKDYIIGTEQMRMESTSGVAQKLIRQWALRGKIISFKDFEKSINAVTVEQVLEVAQEIFKDKGLNLVVVGPYGLKEKEFSKILKF